MHNDTVMVHAMIIVVLATDNDEKDLDIFYIFMKYMILIYNAGPSALGSSMLKFHAHPPMN